MNKTDSLNRRDFLKIGTLASGGLLIAFTIPAGQHLP
ncbi:twin-arginine translocation signal domain-containing protein [Spirosoma telluris]